MALRQKLPLIGMNEGDEFRADLSALLVSQGHDPVDMFFDAAYYIEQGVHYSDAALSVIDERKWAARH